nr:MAG TPA: hypothetical protein [Caudoviricetes sp.]
MPFDLVCRCFLRTSTQCFISETLQRYKFILT